MSPSGKFAEWNYRGGLGDVTIMCDGRSVLDFKRRDDSESTFMTPEGMDLVVRMGDYPLLGEAFGEVRIVGLSKSASIFHDSNSGRTAEYGFSVTEDGTAEVDISTEIGSAGPPIEDSINWDPKSGALLRDATGNYLVEERERGIRAISKTSGNGHAESYFFDPATSCEYRQYEDGSWSRVKFNPTEGRSYFSRYQWDTALAKEGPWTLEKRIYFDEEGGIARVVTPEGMQTRRIATARNGTALPQKSRYSDGRLKSLIEPLSDIEWIFEYNSGVK